jgi:hypothetical protein
MLIFGILDFDPLCSVENIIEVAIHLACSTHCDFTTEGEKGYSYDHWLKFSWTIPLAAVSH